MSRSTTIGYEKIKLKRMTEALEDCEIEGGTNYKKRIKRLGKMRSKKLYL